MFRRKLKAVGQWQNLPPFPHQFGQETRLTYSIRPTLDGYIQHPSQVARILCRFSLHVNSNFACNQLYSSFGDCDKRAFCPSRRLFYRGRKEFYYGRRCFYCDRKPFYHSRKLFYRGRRCFYLDRMTFYRSRKPSYHGRKAGNCDFRREKLVGGSGNCDFSQ